jgi:hypothetical protein
LGDQHPVKWIADPARRLQLVRVGLQSQGP